MSHLLTPSLDEEELLWNQDYRYIAGIDEVGRGALAGPVMAAAVILPPHLNGSWVKLVKDSKLVDSARRELLFLHIHEAAVAIGIGSASSEIIDSQGIVKATELAMMQAIRGLSPAPEALLIDFVRLPDVGLPQKGVVNGDSLCFSIACASIIAKVTRDRLMAGLDMAYPGYSLADHKGYGTAEHLGCLSRLGPTPIHRRSFKPVRECYQLFGAFKQDISS